MSTDFQLTEDESELVDEMLAVMCDHPRLLALLSIVLGRAGPTLAARRDLDAMPETREPER